MSKFTPGPWEVGGPYPSVTVITCIDSGCGGPDPEPPAYEAICLLDDRTEGEPNPIAIANAKLIAAAPELLVLAHRVVEIFGPMQEKGQNGDTFERLLKRAEAIIAKAEGT